MVDEKNTIVKQPRTQSTLDIRGAQVSAQIGTRLNFENKGANVKQPIQTRISEGANIASEIQVRRGKNQASPKKTKAVS